MRGPNRVRCPHCWAKPGRRCVGVVRGHYHLMRTQAAQADEINCGAGRRATLWVAHASSFDQRDPGDRQRGRSAFLAGYRAAQAVHDEGGDLAHASAHAKVLQRELMAPFNPRRAVAGWLA